MKEKRKFCWVAKRFGQRHAPWVQTRQAMLDEEVRKATLRAESGAEV
jgi:hypothetical protein